MFILKMTCQTVFCDGEVHLTWDDIEKRKCTMIEDVERYQILGHQKIVFSF